MLTLLSGFGVLASAGTAMAQSLPADSVTANGAPDRWGHSSCTATLPELSDGSISNPGVCFLGPLDPDYRMTFTFSPAPAQFMTGINIWANAGGSMSDNELRRLDVEVDYFDPATNSTQTLVLDNVDIGDTTSFDDPRFVSFGGGLGLYQVSEVRIDDLVGLSETGRVVFRELQGVFATQSVAPEISIASSESGDVSDGGTDPQGTEPSGVAKTVTYTVTNSGTDTLTLGGTPSVANETNLAGPVTIGAPGSLNLAPGESTTFEVTYTPAAGGAFGFDIDVASNDDDEGTYDIAVSGTGNDVPGVALTAPAGPPGGPFAVTATFSEPVTGMTLADFTVTNGVASGFANPSPGVYTVDVTPTDPSLPVTVVVPAGAANDLDGAPNTASAPLSLVAIGAATPVDLAAIEEIIVEETVRDIRNSIGWNQRALRAARGRHAGFLRCRDLDEDALARSETDGIAPDACPVLRGISVEPAFDGKVSATEDGVSGSGAFFAQRSSLDGGSRRVALGELSFSSYDDGDTAADLRGRVAWETLVGQDVLRGLFIDARATLSDIDDTFVGRRTGYGLSAGAYFVDRLEPDLYWDGYVSFGFGRNNLDLANDTLDVDGDYATASVEAGLAVTGERSFERFELHPEFSIAYGITSVGDAEIRSASATSTATDTISVGDVAFGVVRFRPEFVFASEPNRFGLVQNSLSIAPSALCETVRTDTTENECGGGLEAEWSSLSRDGFGEFSARASREIVGGSTRDQFSVAFERRF
ncbi:MAG: Ig-like domain-containing protein [Paracoccaceae bacterium]|nr:Ig-like domain-containing protein [Paracoccaceae bacterium]